MVESVLIVIDKSPIGKNSAAEAIRIGSGFVALGEIIDCQIVFTSDAVYLLDKHADPTAVGMDSMAETIEIADLSELELFVLDSALEDAGLTEEDLIDYENLKIINFNDLSELIEKAETVFRY